MIWINRGKIPKNTTGTEGNKKILRQIIYAGRNVPTVPYLTKIYVL